jgi:hypothetical protein
LVKRLHLLLLIFVMALLWQPIAAQYITISGTVYDISARKPLEAVAVVSKSGRGTLTDSTGHYSLMVFKTDSIWFSLLNKNTQHYAVDTIRNPDNFDISIHVYSALLPEVRVRNSNYRLDSLQNRKDYQKYFDFKKPGIALSRNPGYNPGGVTVGLDLDEFINMFRFKRNRNLQYLQNRLVQQEQDKYVRFRFSKLLVRKITKLQSPEIDSFMKQYRPSYEGLQFLNDLEFGYYVQQCFEQYKAAKQKGNLRKRDE